MFIDEMLLQFRNAYPKMEVTELGIVTVFSPVQPENAYCPMEVTELGISIEVKPVQPEKALLPMEVTELGIVVVLQPTTNSLVLVLIMALQLSLESYTVFPEPTVICSNPVQPEKALYIEVTELGIAIEAKPLQLVKVFDKEVNPVKFANSLNVVILVL